MINRVVGEKSSMFFVLVIIGLVLIISGSPAFPQRPSGAVKLEWLTWSFFSHHLSGREGDLD